MIVFDDTVWSESKVVIEDNQCENDVWNRLNDDSTFDEWNADYSILELPIAELN